MYHQNIIREKNMFKVSGKSPVLLQAWCSSTLDFYGPKAVAVGKRPVEFWQVASGFGWSGSITKETWQTNRKLIWLVATQLFFIFTPTWGNDPIWLAYFSNGLVQPPTSHVLNPKLPIPCLESKWQFLNDFFCQELSPWQIWGEMIQFNVYVRNLNNHNLLVLRSYHGSVCFYFF